ncbi:SDR family oxidoreductase [uncultured Bartonella sp.]|uniref:SDR family oxidoreductase n=1 Tax=uncultured Bartonella sp. TaxID=104108 RepID=UPI00262FFDCC|nr:SDR family oxidoreductase [uncultured Bartonella sp.]
MLDEKLIPSHNDAMKDGDISTSSKDYNRPETKALLKNPLDAYPRPPYSIEKQQAPGLASKMTPLPDHGEKSYKGSGKLVGRKALITGGDSGIGRAVAIAFAREGADVAINYLKEEESDAQEVIKLIEEAGRKGFAIPGDLTDRHFCKELVEQAAKKLGGLDILVNNAGRQQSVETLADLSDEAFDATMKTNIYAPFRVTKAALAHIPAGGAIIITSSVQAFDPSGSLFDYSQTKAANIAFAKSLAKQLGPKGIRVNAIAPGPFWTPLQPSGGQPIEAMPQFGSETPLSRAGQPVEIAPLYVLLASEQASFCSGQVFGASGGMGMDS